MPNLNGELKALEAEILYTPAELRQGHLLRLEKLLTQIEHDQLYTYLHLSKSITQFTPDSGGEKLISGRDILRELGRLLTTATAAVPIEADEEVLTLFDVARRCRVAPKTIKRWALDGMPLADWCGATGRIGLGVRAAALELYLSRREQRQARRSHRLAQAETEAICTRSDVLTSQSVSPGDIVRQLASESGYSCSTVRRVLNHRRRQSQPAPLPGRMDRALCDQLVTLYKDGASVEELAGKFDKSKATIYRLLHHSLMEKILATQINYIPNPAFAAPDAKTICLGDEGLFTYPPEELDDAKTPPGVPAYLAELYRIPLLTREREAQLFLKYNFIKYRAALLQEKLRSTGYRTGMIERFEKLQDAAEQIRKILVRSNLRLVVSIAKRHAGPLASLFDLVSEGNLCLLRAVECYNCAREARFATYATWAVSKHFARIIPEENYRVGAFVTGQQEMIEATGDRRESAQERGELIEHIRSLISRAAQGLTPREREIIASHYGTDGRQPQTLEEIGGLLGLTRERIRQIESRALGKLRDLLPREAAGLV